MNVPVHPGSEHLLTLPQRDAAEEVAEQLRQEGFADVRVVREAARTAEDDEDHDEDHDWAVYVRDPRLPEAQGGGAYEGLRERFTVLAHEHGGWYDAPGDPRPAQ